MTAASRRGMRLLLVVATIAVVAILALGITAWWTALSVDRGFKGWQAEEVFVEIPQGLGVAGIARRLAEAGVIESPWVFRLAVWQQDGARRLKAGEYRFDRAVTPRQVVQKLTAGEVYLRPITFPEGLTIREMAAIFEDRGFGSARDFEDAARDVGAIAGLDSTARDLEGYLFPDTYQLPRNAAVTALVQQMVQRFREVAGADAPARAAARGRTLREVVTIASLVERETARDDERPVVAGVYANRLRVGMGLQCDPTVIYALVKAGQWKGNLTKDNLQFDSPYNTYRYAGLPPGPIASPGRASLEAAFAPADVPYLYFVSRNDGSHAFAATLGEHNQNVRKFQVEFFRGKRATVRAERGG